MKKTPTPASPTWAIAELARELEISPRAIRFYEEKGLISPRRTAGNQRIYSKRDRARLKLILRGKRFGYSLEEIGEMIGMGAMDMDQEEQIVRSLAYGEQKLADIDRRMEELKLLAEDIQSMRTRLLAKLGELRRKARATQAGTGRHPGRGGRDV